MTGLGNHKLIAIAGEWDTKSALRQVVGRAVNITLKGNYLILEVMRYL